MSCIYPLVFRVGYIAAPACTTDPTHQHMLCHSVPQLRNQLYVSCCVDLVSLISLAPLPPLKRLLMPRLVLFAVQNSVKNLKNVSYACSNITSQVGTSNPRVSRSREHLPCLPSLAPVLSHMLALKLCRYNPVLGEFFRCRYDYPNGTQGFYIAEQGVFRSHSERLFLLLCVVSHHPPVSAFYYVSPANKVSIVGEFRPKSKFLGNSVATLMEGENRISLLGRPEDSGKSIAYSSPSPPFPVPTPRPKTRAD